MKKQATIFFILIFCLALIAGFNQSALAQTQITQTKSPLISPSLVADRTSSVSSLAGLKDSLLQKLFSRLETVLNRLNKIEEKIIAREDKIKTTQKITSATKKNLDKLKTDLAVKMDLAGKQVSASAKFASDLEASPSSKETYVQFRSRITDLKQIFQDILALESQQLQILGKLPSNASISATPKIAP